MMHGPPHNAADGGSFNILVSCPALHAYVNRLARDHDLEIVFEVRP